jgi:hypothetical protein
MAKFMEPIVDDDAQKRTLVQSISAYQHVYWAVDFDAQRQDAPAEEHDAYVAGHRTRVELEDSMANCVSSAIVGHRDSDGEQMHTPAIDIDHKVVALQSSTEGNYHLYIDVPCSWDDYLNLLNAMVQCGIVQQGYVDASVARRATFLRLPWVEKTPNAVAFPNHDHVAPRDDCPDECF